METATASEQGPLRQIPARVSPTDHEEMSRLAIAHGRGVGEEYRVAVTDHLARHRAEAIARAETSQVAEAVR
jgi:hypothetical protein